jgi:hypothetical protein
MSGDSEEGRDTRRAPSFCYRSAGHRETPRLWVNLHLNDFEYQGLNRKFLSRTQPGWFRRCPLSFSVRGCCGVEGFGSDTISTALLPHAPPLQCISLQLEREHFRKLDIVLFPIPETLSLGASCLQKPRSCNLSNLSYATSCRSAPSFLVEWVAVQPLEDAATTDKRRTRAEHDVPNWNTYTHFWKAVKSFEKN